MAKDMH